jgi:hypothetical protein
MVSYGSPPSPQYGVSQSKPTAMKKKFHVAALLGLLLMAFGVLWILIRRAYFSFAGTPEPFSKRQFFGSVGPVDSHWNVVQLAEEVMKWISGKRIEFHVRE